MAGGLAGWWAEAQENPGVIGGSLVTWANIVEDGSGDSDGVLSAFFREQYEVKSLVVGHGVPLPLPQGLLLVGTPKKSPRVLPEYPPSPASTTIK